MVWVKKIAQKKASKVIAKLEKKSKLNSTQDVSNETILYIILSLFPILALIAIYLKEGKNITTNFWIDLLPSSSFIWIVYWFRLVFFNSVICNFRNFGSVRYNKLSLEVNNEFTSTRHTDF